MSSIRARVVACAATRVVLSGCTVLLGCVVRGLLPSGRREAA